MGGRGHKRDMICSETLRHSWVYGRTTCKYKTLIKVYKIMHVSTYIIYVININYVSISIYILINK